MARDKKVILKKRARLVSTMMSSVNIKSASFAVALASLFVGCISTTNRMNETKRLYGTWSCVSAIMDGKSLPEQTVALLRLTLTENRYKTEKGSEVLFDSSYKVDASKNPKEISMVGTEGDLTGKEAQGIYSLKEDLLQICYTMPGIPRPKTFESPAGSKAYLIVWKRLQ